MKRSMVALVVGNADYANEGALRNPTNDANDIAAKLEMYGFQVILSTDATHKEMDKQLKIFKKDLLSNDVGLFFFAGHGLQIEGHNYLLATDTDTDDETEAKHSSLPLDKVLDVMDQSGASTKIIILDACRTNPWERKWQRTLAARGLASVYAPKGTIIGFATSPGQVASDGSGRNGTYTEALLQHIDAPDCPIETMFKRVRNTVASDTQGKQISWEHTSLSGNFFFNMSLAEAIDDYKSTSLADDLFVIDETRRSHKVIQALKSQNWYTQNDGLKSVDANWVTGVAIDNAFVLGRNIYQAACGGSKSAILFVNSFLEQTSGFPEKKRKAILDGMLFEIFFDPRAQLRSELKGKYFNELFDLQRHAGLRSSFAFISKALGVSRGSFYAIPGKDHGLAVSVATRKRASRYYVDGIYVDGEDILRQEDEEIEFPDDEDRSYIRYSAANFEEWLSQELIVPMRMLTITFKPISAKSGPFSIPKGYTIRKQ